MDPATTIDRRRALLGTAALLAGWSPLARTQPGAYPSRPITLVVALQAGSASDIASRKVAERMSKRLGTPVVVENMPGAGGRLGVQRVLNAPPDGYLIAALNNGVVSLLPNLRERPLFDVARLEPVAGVVELPSVLVVPGTLEVRSLGEWIAQSKAPSSRFMYASVGVGSPQHVAMELLKSSTGAKLTHVPYKGGPQAVVDTVNGTVQGTWIAIPVAAPFVKSGQLKPLAVGSAERSEFLPGVPTLREAGVPDFEYVPWLGFYAPPATPRAIIDTLNAAVQEALRDPAEARSLLELGVVPKPCTADDLRRRAEQERQQMAAAVKRLAIE